MIYQVLRSSRTGSQLLPNFYASHSAAREAAIASLSLDAARVLDSGEDGTLLLQADGDHFRLLMEVAATPLVVYNVQVVEVETAETEEIVLKGD